SQKAFGTPNLGGSFLTHDKFYDLIGASALPYNHYFCLSDTGEHIIDFSDSSYVNGYWGLFKQNVPMKGGDVANLAQINFYLLVGDCLYHTATSEVKSALLKAYPVPATDRIVIELPEELLFSYKELAVSDVVGRTSMLKLIEEADTTIGLDISSLSPGFYFGRIDRFVLKFVKQ
ncbi:MAG: T9SS type A sorting domain-containing protein, partial [Saprospiraceae bacterium]|nr:T9SS type A sorting domain-containing protein [Saprospiraceae bacterium]